MILILMQIKLQERESLVLVRLQPFRRLQLFNDQAHLGGDQYTPSGSSQGQQHTAQFCTLKCLHSLQWDGQLDDNCPTIIKII